MKARTPRHAPFFFADPASLPAQGAVVLGGADARHLAVVRRAAPGDAVRVSDGQGRVVEARLVSVTPSRVEAAIVSESRLPPPRPVVEVYQGLAKGDKVDGVVRQLVELGVDGIGVFEAGRSVARWEAAREAAAAARWATIAREAAKQSHRAWLPALLGPGPLEEMVAHLGRLSEAPGDAPSRVAERTGLSEAPGDAPSRVAERTGWSLGLVAHPAAPRRLGDVVSRWATDPPGKVWVAVGPEGGLADEELEAFAAAGAVPVSLGEQILRTETASVVVAALVLHHLGRLG